MSASALGVLARHGRSFHLAGRLLGRELRRDCARLYRFCRYVDDIADGPLGADRARQELDRVEGDLISGRSDDPIIADFSILALTRGVRVDAALELVAGVRQDIGPVRIQNGSELVRYAYRVAGTVGLMMADLLGARSPEADARAVDLGVAMQLTNIARDVVEDARRDRCYLPAERLGGVSIEDILEGRPAARPAVQRASGEVVSLADRYYGSGEAGLKFVPPRSRLAILVASRVYREIGHELRRREFRFWEGRVVVSLPRKLATATRALAAYPAGPPPLRPRPGAL
jgi:phytoene synthase